MNAFVLKLLSMSISGAAVAVLIFLSRPVLRKRASKAFMYYVWAVVLLRLIVPFGVGFELPEIATPIFETEEHNSSSVSEMPNAPEESNNVSFDESNDFSFGEGFEESFESRFEISEESKNTEQSTEPENSIFVSEIIPEYSQDTEDSREEMLPVVGQESETPQSQIKTDDEPNIEQNGDISSGGDISEPKPNKFTAFLRENLFWIWSVGCVAAILWYLVSYILFHHSIKKSFSAPNPDDWKIFNDVCGQNKVVLVMSDVVKIPMLMGVFKPRIVLPKAEYSKNGKAEQLRCILMHELVHYKRRDIVFKWITIFITSLHWFNPIVYFVKNALDEACELSCDEAVIKNMNEAERNLYGNTLIALSSKEERKRFGMAATLCEDKQQLKERLVSIMKYKKLSRSALCIMIVIALLLVGCSLAVPKLGDNSELAENSSTDSISAESSEAEESENSTSENENFDTEQKKLEINENYNALREVLLGEKELYPLVGALNGEESCLIDELSTVLGYTDTSYPIMFTAVDLDRDGKDEVALKLSENDKNDKTFVLHYDDKVYGYCFDDDEMRQLKSDGTFAWYNETESGYAYIESFAHQTSEAYPNAYIKNSFLLAWMEEFVDERVIHYEVNGKLSDVKEFSAQRVIFDEKKAATWYELNEANINNVLTATSEPTELEPFPKTAESERAMRAYNRVMNGEISFVCPKASEDAEEEKYKIDELNTYVTQNTEDVAIIRFTVIDLDGDNIPEIVNWIGAGIDNVNSCLGYQILHYKNARVYSYLLYAREFSDLKYDGTFTWSSGSEYYGISEIKEFLIEKGGDGRDYTDIAIAGSATTATGEYIHYHYDEHISYQEYELLLIEQNEKPSPIWYTFNSDNVEEMISVDILVEQETSNEAPPIINETLETIETIEEPDGTLKTIERSYYADSGVLRREMITLEKNGTKLSREITNYDEDGSIYSHTIETYDGEDTYEEIVWYRKNGYTAGQVEYETVLNGKSIKSKTYFEGELIEEMFYESEDVSVTNYYLNGEIYYYERTFKTVEFITDKGDRPGNIWDEYTTEQYNPDGTLRWRAVGLVSEHPIDDERIVQTHVSEPGHDYWDRWISLGSGDGSEFVAHIATDLTGKGIIRFEKIAEGWTVEEVWALWNDYNAYIEELSEYTDFRRTEIYGEGWEYVN